MAWIQRLYHTYQYLSDPDRAEINQALLPIAHTPQTAHIEVTIDMQGNFLRAQALAPKTQIILPATEKSESRGNGCIPHPLADKLQYCADDYPDFGGDKNGYFKAYFELLTRWADDEDSHIAVRAIKTYLSKKCLVKDLINAEVCVTDDKGMLARKYSGEELPKLFKALTKEAGKFEQGSALVCWRVINDGDFLENTWEDKSLQDNWIHFLEKYPENRLFSWDIKKDCLKIESPKQHTCLASGELLSAATSHPAKLRHSGDKAKIISSNDSSGFTYRGRFATPDQAATISFDATQKAHNALRWLIQQPTSYRRDDQVVLAWSAGQPIETPFAPEQTLANTAIDETELVFNFNFDDEELATDVATSVVPEQSHLVAEDSTTDNTPSTRNISDFGQAFAATLKARLQGFNKQLQQNDSDNIAIIALDSATPGRMAVTYYQEQHVDEYLANLENWYSTFAFHLRKSKDERQGTGPLTWLTAPSLYKIIDAAYGDITKSTATLKKNLLSRLVPCIIEGQMLPPDIVQQAFYRAINRPAFGSEGWRWEEQLGVTCALIRGERIRRETYNKTDTQQYKGLFMALDTERKTRDYLFGRLLAIADNIEQFELKRMSETRPSNAERLMQNFQQRPVATWLTVEMQIRPYINRLKQQREDKIQGFIRARENLLDQVMATLGDRETRTDHWVDKPLGSEFLLGFHNQRHELFRSKGNNTEQQAEQAGANS